ncbi:MAG: phenylalanine--tRNA ligase subunit alpha [Candidatus Levybacteria bacterium]|nr:phenylalanine--tRNA ligase subunit alpha [Candidatus Levybacteria bacterium]
MEEELINIKNTALSFILEAQDRKSLEETKLQFLGRSGKLTLALKQLPKLPIEKRAAVGELANEIKRTIEEALAEKLSQVTSDSTTKRKESIDRTVPTVEPRIGHIHPISQVLSQTIEIFKSLGFQVADGPEIESDHYNFEVLNIPKYHPSRDTQQTLFLDSTGTSYSPGEMLLRTQTSNMQGRIMEKTKPPFRVLVPGKVFRYEQVDASHGFEFWQVEGFMVDKNVSMSHLFGTLDYFFKQFFGQSTKVKFVCHNFPFVEPGVEAYISCVVCRGKGCSFCKRTGWVEILGAGMIHPNVLKAVGINPNEWSGFAFGTGLSRMATLKFEMDDLRLLTTPDLRILEQF